MGENSVHGHVTAVSVLLGEMKMPLDRRELLISAASVPLVGCLSPFARREERTVGELALELHRTLTAEQRKLLCLPEGDERRTYINNDWFVVDPLIGDILTPSQQDLALKLFLGLHAPDFVGEALRQVSEDNHAPGVNGASLAFFGEPATSESERGLGVVFAARHTTRRWEEKPKSPFSGSVFMGHASGTFFEEPTHPGNVWWYQGLAASKLYTSLDEPHREATHSSRKHVDKPKCLLGPREERGLAFKELDADRLELARALVESIVVRPFRPAAAEQAMHAIASRGGVEALNIHFFRKQDYGDDGVFDNFEIWGPGFMVAFRGEYHCHCWLRVDGPAVG